jgi:ubiquinone/menaquinone biosynthesis C-methylase UbiE
VTNIFNKYYKRYDEWYEKNKYAYLSELDAIRKVLPKKGKGLEIGVGTGRFASALGIKYGVEPSTNMARLARKRGVEVYLGYGGALPFIDESFDYVLMAITICFIKDPRQALDEARRVLKKDGKIIIGIVDKHSFLGKFYLKKKNIFYEKATFFGVKGLTALLEKSGFKRFSYYQTLFALPNNIKTVEKPRKGFGEGGFVVISAKKEGGYNNRDKNKRCKF